MNKYNIFIMSMSLSTLIFAQNYSQSIICNREAKSEKASIHTGNEVQLSPKDAAQTRCLSGFNMVRHNYMTVGITGKTEDYDYYVCEPSKTGISLMNECLKRKSLTRSDCSIIIEDDPHWDGSSYEIPKDPSIPMVTLEPVYSEKKTCLPGWHLETWVNYSLLNFPSTMYVVQLNTEGHYEPHFTSNSPTIIDLHPDKCVMDSTINKLILTPTPIFIPLPAPLSIIPTYAK